MSNAADALEQLVEIHGGERHVKFHYVVDRWEFLARLADLKGARIPRPKLSERISQCRRRFPLGASGKDKGAAAQRAC